MAFKLKGTGSNVTKMYLFPMAYAGPLTSWVYVSADTPATVAGSGYITAGTNNDHDTALGMLRPGDTIYAYQVGSIDDSRTIEDDIEAGLTDYTKHVVLVNTGSVIDLSDDLYDASGVTYGS